MKRKLTSPVPPANPIADFFSNLPRKAKVLGFQIYQFQKCSEAICIYSFNGSTVKTSFKMEGGTNEG